VVLFPRYLFEEVILKSVTHVVLLSLTLVVPAFADKLVDPAAVAPEYREAAEKRRAEQIKQRACAQRAEAEKVLPRERTAFLLQCLEAETSVK
jgi:hypothetical protein